MRPIKQILRQIVVNHIYMTDWYQNRRRKKTIGETGTQSLSPKDAAGICLEIFHKYCREAGWAVDDVEGKSILEIGPGELLGVGLLFALHGAKRVVVVDQFEEFKHTNRTRAITEELQKILSDKERIRWNELVDSDGYIRLDTDALRYIHHMEFEKKYVSLLPPYDLICSNAVLEHVANMPACFAGQAKLLLPGACAVHQVDLRSHDSQNQKHPLEFLEYPDWLWGLMTNRMDGPNRLRVSDYERLADEYGFKITRMSVTHQLTPDVVQSRRARLSRRFKKSPDRDLLIDGILFTMCKKA